MSSCTTPAASVDGAIAPPTAPAGGSPAKDRGGPVACDPPGGRRLVRGRGVGAVARSPPQGEFAERPGAGGPGGGPGPRCLGVFGLRQEAPGRGGAGREAGQVSPVRPGGAGAAGP